MGRNRMNRHGGGGHRNHHGGGPQNRARNGTGFFDQQHRKNNSFKLHKQKTQVYNIRDDSDDDLGGGWVRQRKGAAPGKQVSPVRNTGSDTCSFATMKDGVADSLFSS